MQITVRPWQPEDRFAAWSVLREASFSNVWPSFLVALRRPATIVLFLVVMATCVVLDARIIVIVFWFTGLVCAVYSACLVATVYFLYGPNFNDMKKMESTYFSSPDDHFWVAQVEKEIVGTIAVVKKSPQLGTGYEADQSKVNSSMAKTVHKRTKATDDSVEPFPKTAWLRRMAVKKQFRGCGIAKRLVQVVIDYCKEQNYDRIFLITTEVHQPARSLYTHIGFKQKAFNPYRYLGGFFTVWTYEFEMVLTK